MEFFSSRENQLDAERRRRKSGTIADGERVSFDLLMRDGSSGSTFLTDSVTLTDAERNLAVQRAMNVHLSHQRYSSNPLPFTDAQAADAIQQAKAEKARKATSTQAADDRAQAQRDQARDDYISRLVDSSKALRTARYQG